MAQERFWNSSEMEPKRNYRFILTLGNEPNIAEHIVKSSGRPTYTVNVSEHKYLNHNFKFPGEVNWEDLDVTFVDPISHDAAQKTKEMILQSGYRFPRTPGDKETVSKSKSVDALGKVRLQQISADNNIVDTYELVNAWISNIEYSDFSYDDDELSDITLTLQYDFAVLNDEKEGGRSLSDIFS